VVGAPAKEDVFVDYVSSLDFQLSLSGGLDLGLLDLINLVGIEENMLLTLVIKQFIGVLIKLHRAIVISTKLNN